MEDIKTLIEDFVLAEMNAYEALEGDDLSHQHETCENMYSYTHGLKYKLGIVKQEELYGSDIFFGDDIPKIERRKRIIYKISQYSNSEGIKTWVAYVSTKNPMLEYHTLSHAFFIQMVHGTPKIVKTYDYSSYPSDGTKYEWSENEGLEGVTFESIGSVEKIDRYIEPSDERSKELYLKDS